MVLKEETPASELKYLFVTRTAMTAVDEKRKCTADTDLAFFSDRTQNGSRLSRFETVATPTPRDRIGHRDPG